MRSAQNFSLAEIFYITQLQKLRTLAQKNIPPPKKGPLGGGEITRPLNPGMTWAAKTFPICNTEKLYYIGFRWLLGLSETKRVKILKHQYFGMPSESVQFAQMFFHENSENFLHFLMALRTAVFFCVM